VHIILLPVEQDIDRARKQIEFVLDQPFDKDRVKCIVAYSYTDETSDEPVDRPRSVSMALDDLSSEGYTTEFRELNSPPSDGIKLLAEETDVDHIVMSGRKLSPAKKIVFGSVTQIVILNMDIPVTVVGTHS
jgi:nucleotide-binding universal stress UspA family protein